MDSLIAKAEAIRPLQKKRKLSANDHSKKRADETLNSISKHTSLPKSLKFQGSLPEGSVGKHNHIPNPKLRTQLTREAVHTARSKALLKDAEEMLLMGDAGRMEVEGEMDRTWRVSQSEVADNAGLEVGKGRKEWKLEGGPYRSRYSRNGRHLAVAGKTGHVATFDWQTGTLHTELQLRETCRDITFFQDQSHFAVAQKKYVYIYDRDGVELHCLKSHIEPTRLEFLPYHWLLASVGNAGYLKYQDTSTGQLLSEHRTKFGACNTMTQNHHNAVIHLGHQNGIVTLWTPNLPHPAVQILAHLGPVSSVSVDASTGGRYMATAGLDSSVKVWDCRNWKGAVREWDARSGGGGEVEWSAKGMLAVGSGGTVNVYSSPSVHEPWASHAPPPLYLTNPLPSHSHRPLKSIRFCPYQDILTIGHSQGLSSILVPGSGEPNFDSGEADPFEKKKGRREREVRSLLDKIQPDMISLDSEFVGSLAPPSKLTTAVGGDINLRDTPFARLPRLERLRVQGKADETELMGDDGGDEGGENKKEDREEREKRKMRGKGKSMKRYLRKQRKNVIDPTAVAVRAKLEKQKQERKAVKTMAAAAAAGVEIATKRKSALDRFKRTD